MCRGVFHRALLDFGDPARNRNDHPGTNHSPPVVNFADKVPEHRLGHFEVRDHPVFKRADGNNVAGSSAKHAFGFVTHSENAVGALLNGNDRGLAQNNTMVFDIDESVCGP